MARALFASSRWVEAGPARLMRYDTIPSASRGPENFRQRDPRQEQWACGEVVPTLE